MNKYINTPTLQYLYVFALYMLGSSNGLRNGVYNCITIFFPCKHENIILRQPCAFAACYFKMSYALGWKILGMQ